ncbi:MULTISPECIES: Uma2 family endonuclease [unclassified Thiocapsa]|uniref:Uma2 family endonuclease n=1 Tax=unclassified Thiocapsa TaxID=2641286 RepID=UPI0035B193B3
MNPLLHIDPDDPYPESDGQPMADNTEQYDWIVKIKENLEILFADRPDVFIAGDLLWYPVPDRRETGPIAPDVLVAFGRPKGRRGSYRQWEEGGIAPQVVFEILSLSNSEKEMADKLAFYGLYGVEEYYLYDPERNRLEIWIRRRTDDGTSRLTAQSHVRGWTSPRLGMRFAVTPETLELFDPSGRPFLTSIELARRADAEQARAVQEAARADHQAERADQEAIRAEQEAIRAREADARADREHARAERLAERLRALGIDPDAGPQ